MTAGVTAVVPTRDRPELLRRAVASVLAQDHPGPIECLVVYDQSEPAPVDLDPPAGRTIRTLVNNRTPGLPGARNTGIAAATHDLVAMCDDDDEWLPGRLRTQVALLQNHPGTQVVGGGLELVYEDRRIERSGNRPVIGLEDLYRSRCWEALSASALLMRRQVFDLAGLVDEELPGGYLEDYEWLLRAARHGPIRVVTAPVARVYWHGSSFFADRWRTIARAIDYVLVRHPELRNNRAGYARLLGQRAFALAAAGDRPAAARAIAEVLRVRPAERRSYLAALVAWTPVKADTLVHLAHRSGRGI